MNNVANNNSACMSGSCMRGAAEIWCNRCRKNAKREAARNSLLSHGFPAAERPAQEWSIEACRHPRLFSYTFLLLLSTAASGCGKHRMGISKPAQQLKTKPHSAPLNCTTLYHTTLHCTILHNIKPHCTHRNVQQQQLCCVEQEPGTHSIC